MASSTRTPNAFDIDKEHEGETVVSSGDLSSVVRDKDGRFHVRLATGPSDCTPKAIRKFAMKRLLSDWQECKENPLGMIAAEPIKGGEDLFEWHANLVGPPGSSYEDCAFHLIIIVPQEYPNKAPRVEIQSYFEHKNVFGKWICLDMLEGQWCPDDPKTQKKKDVGYGWTPAYSIQSILVQLQAFLFDSVDQTSWSETAEKHGYTTTTMQARAACKYFRCERDHKFSKKEYRTRGCKHTGKHPWPQPLVWKDRMRFIVPSSEIGDVMDTKSNLWQFLERMSSLIVENKWPRIIPLGPGSFFSYTLLPWFQTFDEPAFWEAMEFRRKSSRKTMRKGDGKIIRGLIRRAIAYLHQKPKPPPMKCVFLQKMYEIESAVDIAVNYTYNSQNLTRTRGYWKWYHVDTRTLSEDSKDSKDAKEGNKDTSEKKEDGKDQNGNKSDAKQKKGEWLTFPLHISDQIEAIYLKKQADIRRPRTLVEILPKRFKTWEECKRVRKEAKEKAKKDGVKQKKSNKGLNIVDSAYNSDGLGKEFGIITYPKGYYWWFHYKTYKDFSDEEKQSAYQPYSGTTNKVRVMKVDPIRTFVNPVMWWMNGPNYRRGRTMYGYQGYKTYHYRSWRFAHKCMILERFRDDKNVWNVNLHPMPDRIASQSRACSKEIDISRLKIAGEGVKYKAYIRGEDNLHYVIDVDTNTVRCVEEAAEYKLARHEKEYSVEQLWNQIKTKAHSGMDDDVDVPWKQKKKEEIKPLPLLDFKKFRKLGICAFIDIADSEDEDDMDSDDEDSDDEDQKNGQKSGRDGRNSRNGMEGETSLDEQKEEMMRNERKYEKNEKNKKIEKNYDKEDAKIASKELDGTEPNVEKVEKIEKIEKVVDTVEKMENLPRMSDKVYGKVVGRDERGVWVDIGYKRHAYLALDQMRASKAMINRSMRYYNDLRKEQKEEDKYWKKYAKKLELKDNKDEKNEKKKNNVNNVSNNSNNTNETAGGSGKKKKKKRRKKKPAAGTSGTVAASETTGQNGQNTDKKNNSNQTQSTSNAPKSNKASNNYQNESKSATNGANNDKRRRRRKKGTINNNANSNGTNSNANETNEAQQQEQLTHRQEQEAEAQREQAELERIREEEEYYNYQNYQRRLYRRKPFSLPKNLFKPNQIYYKIGDMIGLDNNNNHMNENESESFGLWVEDIDDETDLISLTQLKPLELFSQGDFVIGRVRSIISYAAFIDIGAEYDAFLHKEKIESGLKNRILFDCSNENIGVKIGDIIKLEVTKVNTGKGSLEVKFDLREEPPDHLQMPEDVDESKAVKYSIFGLLADDLNELIFQFLDRGTLHRCRDVCLLFNRIIDDRTGLRWEIEELRCFHSKDHFRDCVLGFGVNVERYPNSSMICAIDPKLDLLSARSYRDFDVRCNVWKEPFSHWLPVYINKDHGQRSMAWIKRSMTEMMQYKDQIRDWNPFYVLKIIPALMNTMVVKVMKGELHESIVALEGYTMFYHLMLAFVHEYPKLQTFIEENIIERFLTSEDCRSKKEVSSLGEWIAMLSASNKYTWRDVKLTYLRENFDRHVKWILMQHNQLLDYDGNRMTPKYVRIKKSFNASIVSLKLCMFHVTFLRLFRYSQRSGTVMSVEETKNMLDRLHGRPTYNMKISLQKSVKRIKKLSSYKEFFKGIGVKCPSDDNLYSWLMTSLDNSQRRGYHKPWHYLPKKKKKVDNTMGGLFDKFDDMGEAWAAKNLGGSGAVQVEKKQKKMSLGDQMINGF